MKSVNDVVPESLLSHFRETVPGFEYEDKRHQMALARMAWFGREKRRQHSHFDDYASFSHAELREDFGRGKFSEINSRIEFFRVTPNWSFAESYTRGYRLSPQVEARLTDYLGAKPAPLTALLYGGGLTRRSLPRAVASQDRAGKTTTAWRGCESLNRVPVNVRQLDQTRIWLAMWRRRFTVGDGYRRGPQEFQNAQQVERLQRVAAQIAHLSSTAVSGQDHVMHRYVQAQSGRLYAQGINLQTAPTLIRQAALAGMWDYDFANCHYAILTQMAAESGYDCPAISRYLVDKAGTRQRIADQAGITVSKAKTCLIAILYGARASEWHDSAIRKAIGLAASRRLATTKEFKDIVEDIKGSRKAVLANWPRTANGSLTNLFGKAVGSNEPPKRQLAHLTQGVEAACLRAAILPVIDKVVLLQHDGFVASTKLDKLAIEAEVLRSTGYRLQVEEKLIEVDVYAHHEKAQSQK